MLMGYIHIHIPYTRNFSQYANFTDFAVSRAAVKIHSMKILPLALFKSTYVACEFVV